MKKLALAAAAAAALAAPAFAQEAPANPFASTQGLGVDPIVIVGIIGGIVIVAAASSDGT